MGYLPPQLRNDPSYKPRDLSRKPKPPPIDYTKVKTREQMFDEYQKQNYGKADAAWEETSYKNIDHYDSKKGNER